MRPLTENRIAPLKKLPKVNTKLAERMLAGKHQTKGAPTQSYSFGKNAAAAAAAACIPMIILETVRRQLPFGLIQTRVPSWFGMVVDGY